MIAMVVLLSGLLPVASAEPASFALEGGLPLRAAGEVGFDAPEGNVFAQDLEGELEWVLKAHSMEVRVVENWREERNVPVSGPPLHHGSRVAQELTLTGVEMVVRERVEGFETLAWTREGAAWGHAGRPGPASAADPDWRLAPDLRLDRLSTPLHVESPVPQQDSKSIDRMQHERFSRAVPQGQFALTAPDATFALSGEISGYLFGAHAVALHRDGTHSMRLTQSAEQRDGDVYVVGMGWTGPGDHEERVVRHLEFEAQNATLSLVGSKTDMAMHADQWDLDLDGHLAVPRAQGSLNFPQEERDTTWDVDGGAVVVSGALAAAVHPASEEDRADVSGTGEFAYVASGAREAWPMMGTIASVAGVMFVVAALLGAAQWLSASPVVPLFSRLESGKVLSHPLRGQLYTTVRQRPGVSPQELVIAHEAGWSTVVYHLRVLEQHGLVTGVRDGRHRRFFDCTSGRWANGRKTVLATMLNPTTAKVACLVQDEPGVAQRSLAERLELAPSSVNWHVRRLVKVGLLERERTAQGIALQPGEAWAALKQAQALDFVAAVAAGEESVCLEGEERDGVQEGSNGDHKKVRQNGAAGAAGLV